MLGKYTRPPSVVWVPNTKHLKISRFSFNTNILYLRNKDTQQTNFFFFFYNVLVNVFYEMTCWLFMACVEM